MKKKTKLWLSAVFAILVIVVAVLGWAGNYFYTLAIDANSDKSVVFGSEERTAEEIKASDAAFDRFMKQGSDTYLTNADGYRIHAYQRLQERSTHEWVIVVHGYMSEGRNMVSMGNRFAQMGFHVLIPDLRGHGQSEGDAIGMGAWDSDDIKEWIDAIVAQDQDARIVLYGVSMGASTVMMTTGKDITAHVYAAIEDCGYTSAWEEFAYQLDVLFGLPSFPALDAANVMTRLRAGYDLKDADAVKAVKRSMTPTLFIHGDADDFVPTSMVDTLYDAASCEKERLIVKGAGHAKSLDVDPNTYWKTIENFIEKHRN